MQLHCTFLPKTQYKISAYAVDKNALIKMFHLH